jgi:hypothetical protein
MHDVEGKNLLASRSFDEKKGGFAMSNPDTARQNQSGRTAVPPVRATKEAG